MKWWGYLILTIVGGLITYGIVRIFEVLMLKHILLIGVFVVYFTAIYFLLRKFLRKGIELEINSKIATKAKKEADKILEAQKPSEDINEALVHILNNLHPLFKVPNKSRVPDNAFYKVLYEKAKEAGITSEKYHLRILVLNKWFDCFRQPIQDLFTNGTTLRLFLERLIIFLEEADAMLKDFHNEIENRKRWPSLKLKKAYIGLETAWNNTIVVNLKGFLTTIENELGITLTRDWKFIKYEFSKIYT
jgi:hypothetical protein